MRTVTPNQAVQELNQLLDDCIKSSGLGSNIKEFDLFDVHTSSGSGGEFSSVIVPFGLQLKCIGHWTETVTIHFKQQSYAHDIIPTLTWSSGGGAAEANLIFRARMLCDALTLAFSEWQRRNKVSKKTEA